LKEEPKIPEAVHETDHLVQRDDWSPHAALGQSQRKRWRVAAKAPVLAGLARPPNPHAYAFPHVSRDRSAPYLDLLGSRAERELLARALVAEAATTDVETGGIA